MTGGRTEILGLEVLHKVNIGSYRNLAAARRPGRLTTIHTLTPGPVNHWIHWFYCFRMVDVEATG